MEEKRTKLISERWGGRHDAIGKELYKFGEMIVESRDRREIVQKLNGHIRGMSNGVMTPTRERRIKALKELMEVYG